ncbi:MAG: hypothetical protein O7C01_06080 [Actinobacteria bacterium]|nr:hypothetical protein [Actinomycetota bacterium]
MSKTARVASMVVLATVLVAGISLYALGRPTQGPTIQIGADGSTPNPERRDR